MVHRQRVRVRGFGDGDMRKGDDAYRKPLQMSRIRGSLEVAERLAVSRDIPNNEWDLYFSQSDAGRIAQNADKGMEAAFWGAALVACVVLLSWLLVHLISSTPKAGHSSSKANTPAPQKRIRPARVTTTEKKKKDVWSADQTVEIHIPRSDKTEPSAGFKQSSNKKTLNHRKIASSTGLPSGNMPTPGAYPHPGGYYKNPNDNSSSRPCSKNLGGSTVSSGIVDPPRSNRGPTLTPKPSKLSVGDVLVPLQSPGGAQYNQTTQHNYVPPPRRMPAGTTARAQPMSGASSLPSLASNDNLTPTPAHQAAPASPSLSLSLPDARTPGSDEARVPYYGNFHDSVLTQGSMTDKTPRVANRMLHPVVPEEDEEVEFSVPFVPPLQHTPALSPPRSLDSGSLGLNVPMDLNKRSESPPDPESARLGIRWPAGEDDSSTEDSKQFAIPPTKEKDASVDPLGILADSKSDTDSVEYSQGDPRPGIKHERANLTHGTDATSSMEGAISFSELEMVEVIGGGGFGQVWRANWLGTPVAVKVLTGSAQSSKVPRAVLEEFAAEINLLKGMRHPNVCLYIGAVVTPPNRAIVTELASNGSLWDALRLPLAPPYFPCDGASRRGTWPDVLYQPDPRHGAPPILSGTGLHTTTGRIPQIPPQGSWPWVLVKKVAIGAARGMAYLHSGGTVPVLHRDLKVCVCCCSLL